LSGKRVGELSADDAHGDGADGKLRDGKRPAGDLLRIRHLRALPRERRDLGAGVHGGHEENGSKHGVTEATENKRNVHFATSAVSSFVPQLLKNRASMSSAVRRAQRPRAGPTLRSGVSVAAGGW